jgi:hypothetical protein
MEGAPGAGVGSTHDISKKFCVFDHTSAIGAFTIVD